MPRKRKDFYKITPKILKKVEDLASKGCYQNDIAISIGWGKTFFYDNLKDKKGNNTELAEALIRGQSKRIVTLTNSLAKRADGFKYKEKHVEEVVDKETGVTKDKKVKTVTKYVPPDVGAIEFSLTNLDGNHWKKKHDHNVSGDIIIRTDSDDNEL